MSYGAAGTQSRAPPARGWRRLHHATADFSVQDQRWQAGAAGAPAAARAGRQGQAESRTRRRAAQRSFGLVATARRLKQLGARKLRRGSARRTLLTSRRSWCLLARAAGADKSARASASRCAPADPRSSSWRVASSWQAARATLRRCFFSSARSAARRAPCTTRAACRTGEADLQPHLLALSSQLWLPSMQDEEHDDVG